MIVGEVVEGVEIAEVAEVAEVEEVAEVAEVAEVEEIARAAEGVEFAGAAEGVEAADVVLVASSVRLGSRLDQRRSWSSAKSAPLLIESERTTMLICKSHSNGPTTRVQRPTATHTATRRWHEPKRYIKNLVPPAM